MEFTKDQPLIDAHNVGLKFSTNRKREDTKSLVYDFLLGVTKKESEFWALKCINFKAFKGEIIGIIGSNGAGKTTLCRVVSKLFRPDTGYIDVKGEISALLSLGTGFNKELSGKENIYLNGMMLGFSKKEIDRLYPEIVDFADLGKFIDYPIKYYSKGMKARLGFSIASMLEPEILVLDEALSTGDLSFKERAARKMRQIVNNAKMVLIVSHEIDFIKNNCTKAMWIKDGTVKAFGDPGKVAEQYILAATPPKKKKSIVSLKETERKIGKETIIKVSGIGYKYRLNKKEDFWALKNISFTVKRGEVVGIIGHNGAGKSTLCKVLCKINKADEGSVEINGQVAALLSFGAGFNKQLSGGDNIYLNGLMLGLPKKRITMLYDDIVKFAGLEKFIDTPVKYYSSGMRSKLGFSIATMVEPDVFIIDEALSAGDLSFYEKASGRIQEMISASRAVMVVTHSMGFVEKVCTRAIWLEKGQVKFDGDAKEAVKRYRENAKKLKKQEKQVKNRQWKSNNSRRR
ncbi:ABC transporter ATP-binding protein [Desulfallas thermosapovorans]|uniref:ABC transporter ATP-binding protein n=1 Tax=Desulfallas thermosapovorans TaxID=58137 RepID=UPI001FA944B1|nr:ATP-binding cassette domain-containing protein [Desulfallas thermosapovorans]